jgi:maltose alpha-D-glucosyltransferase / alpha-amylase
MPGSPILYYGDEIGMGDNIYLGDRNGVRTPMQWSADKNAGFSRANPHSLYLPVNIDPEFHYEAINVEVQETNLSSFLWWMRRIIAIRKRFPALGAGDFQMLAPTNNKVVAFTRTYETQTVLVVINLSRFSQAVELDLKPFTGWTPEDAFGHGRFPVIKDALYPITLGPNSFFWLLLVPPDVGAPEGELVLPTISYDGTAAWWQTNAGTRFLDRELTVYMRRCRWYRSKARSIISVNLIDIIDFAQVDQTQMLVIAVNFSEGARDLYCLPIKLISGDEARSVEVEYPAAIIAKVGTEGDLLVDAIASETFQASLLNLMADNTIVTGRSGRLVPAQSKGLHDLLVQGRPTSSKVLKVEQSNSSIIFGEQIYVKLFRKLDEGLNPDLEVTKQLSERCGFEHVPTYLGDIQYLSRGQEPAAVVMAQGFTSNEQDGWSQTLAAVDRYFDRILADPTLEAPPNVTWWDPIPDPYSTLIEGVHLEAMRLLGQRTAEMHLALASDQESPDFRPEPFSLQHQRSVYQSIRTDTKHTLALLTRLLGSLEEYPKALADEVLQRVDILTGCHEYLIEDTIQTSKIRIHGDYHLGQVLYTGKDYVILDFEGEPARALGERRLKRSALIDVAGMFRSFHYVAHYGLLESRTVRPQDRETLGTFADIWATRAAQVFLAAYLETAGAASFVPADRTDLRLLLRSYAILKAMYELRYELNNRPKWAAIPLRGLLQLASKKTAANLVTA